MEDEHLVNSEHFWSHVQKADEEDCWPWTAARYPRGYGAAHVSRHVAGGASTVRYAHRVAWALTNGALPKGLDVMHSCDNPPCCNPRHLRAGTRSDNMRDAAAKGRMNTPSRVGNRNGRARLTEDNVRSIRQRVTAGETRYALAKEFGVSWTAITYAVKGRNWPHVA